MFFENGVKAIFSEMIFMLFYPFNPKNRTCIDQKTPETIQIKQKEENLGIFFGYLIDFSALGGSRLGFTDLGSPKLGGFPDQESPDRGSPDQESQIPKLFMKDMSQCQIIFMPNL